MIVVDTSVWIDYFNGNSSREVEILDGVLGNEPVVTGDIILAEVLQGFRRDADFRKALQLLSHLEFQEMLGRRNAIEAARNFRLLRRTGVTVRKTIDVMIATFCLVNGHALLHADRDFDAMERHLGLQVVR